ncbi:carbohydrate ABC transporter permease [Paenibacillus sepulcri]|uniref:Carbohydrate ABC transporter permease n=2 Tax=Paenibacillus sepulcri TaxID=359917 RepID=A0ABS7BXJ3_9BACL|nr:carbohydrate ABC transporter permease [Paenibacillus sepulcri]
MVISSSLTSERYIQTNGFTLFPRDFSMEAYRFVFQNPWIIIRAYGVTLFVTIAGTGLAVFLNTMTGYVLHRKDFKWRNYFSFYFFFTMLFNGGLVPWYILCIKYLGMKNQLLALFVPTLISVWNILLVKGFMMSVPHEITESAKMDGAGDFRIFMQLIIPLSTPVIVTIGLFTSLFYWNDWFASLIFISDPKLYTLQYLLYNLLASIESLRMVMAASGMVVDSFPTESIKMALTIIVTGPIFLLYPFVQKYFVKGLTIGAVKG